ncbi:hypothetical protein TBLA_0A08260 [Henningerozyma blattae CBS 6284]|uniref:PIN domain-containing protein n=1 Tax=Henningerozyma blattae (strain ATCC 34711 / CBS 6284 / DSM 70876 / NBRC 10599 / NRRL Y-10934 / UCD 77-7) TaxID=1071380 RepID=I2GWW3_HENB6|nr:hypothetical protein TBLA_0A08260 [Tetrapisispora blattae CBS 6284]CCH58615.1 hypothetical protein TBLA_0A08260 [Tetrapisispora blattae CBS 6284]
MVNVYNFILDASAFEKGLGNIKRWCAHTDNKVKLNLYIPTYTLKELEFLKFKKKSFMAREALKFIDSLTSKHGKDVELIIELSDILDIITWQDVIESANGVPKDIDTLMKIPRRLKNLLKSCVYKSHMEEGNAHWILLTENQQIRDLAFICNINWCSVVMADTIISKELDAKIFKESEKFNEEMLKNGEKQSSTDGKEVIRTEFDKTVYASRGSGVLWAP